MFQVSHVQTLIMTFRHSDIPLYRLFQITRVLVTAQLAMMRWHVYTGSPKSRKTLILDDPSCLVQATNNCRENCCEYEFVASNLPIGPTYKNQNLKYK